MSKPFKQSFGITSPSFLTLIFVLVFTFVLSGCGGGGGSARMETPTPMPYVVDGLVANPSPSAFANSAGDTLESVLAQGEMLAPMTVGIEIDQGFQKGGVVSAPKEGTTYLKSISSDGAGGFHVNYVVAGEETPIHLTSADTIATNSYRKVTDDGSGYWFWQHSNFFSSQFTYFDARSWRYRPAPGSGPDRRGIFAYGARTVPENLPTMGSATYEGRMRGDIWNADDASFNTSRRSLRSHLTLKANFDDGEISGWINRFRVVSSRDEGENSSNLSRGNLITISGGEIDDGRFTADWMGEDSDMSRAPENSMSGFSGKMLGEFFGPAAEEVGGVLNGNRGATATTPDQYIFGAFGGRERVGSRVSTEEFSPLTTAVNRGAGAAPGVGAAAADEAYLKSISRDGAGGFRVTYVTNGKESEAHFGLEDLDLSSTFRKEVGGILYFLIDYDYGTFTYHDVNAWIYHDEAENDSYWGFSAHGTRTAPENLPTTGSATYEGYMRSDVWQGNDQVSSTSRTRVVGDLTLEANFGDSEISGRIDGIKVRRPGESGYGPLGGGNSNSLGISGGQIAGSGFTANWAGEDTDAGSAPKDSVRGFSGAMNGGFYGPAAEEVGGVMSGSRAATATTPGQLIVGGFGGRKTGQ